jgi:hypothetical protein
MKNGAMNKKWRAVFGVTLVLAFAGCEPSHGNAGYEYGPCPGNGGMLPPETVIYSVSGIGRYLAGQSGGGNAEDPVELRLQITLDSDNWAAIFREIDKSYKFVGLDLSACPVGSQKSGGGLYADGIFDSFYANPKAKWQVVSLVLPDAAKSVRADSEANPTFAGFALLKTVSGTNVTAIGDYAFLGCPALSSVNLPEATAIGLQAFLDCAALASVSLPKAASIGGGAFYGCDALERITIGANCNIGLQGDENGRIDKFKAYYNDTTAKAAGVYTYSGSDWSWAPLPGGGDS